MAIGKNGGATIMLTHLAFVSETEHLGLGRLSVVAAALQKQVLRDIAPIWNTPATVDAFEVLEDVPIGYWPIIIMDDIGYPGAAGIHLDNNGQPFALVQYSNRWELTASHEVGEMLIDPYGNRLVASVSINPNEPGRMEYLVEICDPSEAWQFGYTVNGIQMSDFYTPAYFDPIQSAGVRYSFTGALTEPRQVLYDGYLSWRNPETGVWWQRRMFGGIDEIISLGLLDAAAGSFRTQIDSRSMRDELYHGMPDDDDRVAEAHQLAGSYAKPATVKAQQWRDHATEIRDTAIRAQQKEKTV